MKKALQVLISSLALAACAHVQPIDPPLQTDWDRTLSLARRDIGAGNYYAADRILDDFVREHPGTPEAREITFWKAAYLIDPANDHGSLAGGIAVLDAYLAADSAGLYREQAAILRRMAAFAQGMASPPTTSVGPNSAPAAAAKDTSKSKDEQIAALKDQLAKSKDDLAKANAELDRIKKRLANPRN